MTSNEWSWVWLTLGYNLPGNILDKNSLKKIYKVTFLHIYKSPLFFKTKNMQIKSKTVCASFDTLPSWVILHDMSLEWLFIKHQRYTCQRGRKICPRSNTQSVHDLDKRIEQLYQILFSWRILGHGCACTVNGPFMDLLSTEESDSLS